MLQVDHQIKYVTQSVRFRPDATTRVVFVIDGAMFAWRVKLLPLTRHDAREVNTLMAGM